MSETIITTTRGHQRYRTEYLTTPQGQRYEVDVHDRVACSQRVAEALENEHPDLFIIDEYDGLILTDDLDELLSAQEIGFEFSYNLVEGRRS